MAAGATRGEAANAAATAVEISRFPMTYLLVNTSEEAMSTVTVLNGRRHIADTIHSMKP
ncbi:hypothetical protein Airi02_016520 [Actinoallomurus iriomotensis]|uniref:Uncharacterized protein n=1 Tax=Actinoallomurus iriomotensis TaxID=478107 RepID=A0A9W6VST8_9ACTN|nr:hypothetical protein Airi02_016520 [Actinoallomurus iriomotensis]